MSYAVGEDRSNYQAIGAWTQDFGFCKATEGLTYLDPTFAQNWKNLKADGKPRGAYHFFHPALDPVAQARFFMAYVKAHGLQAGDMLVIDCELFINASAAESVPQPEAPAPRMHLPPQPFTAYANATCSHSSLQVPLNGVTGWCYTCQRYCGGADSQGSVVACPGCTAARARTLGAFSLESVVIQFLDEVAALAVPGCKVLLYTFQNMAEGFTSALSGKYPDLWIAAYGISAGAIRLGPWASWKFWQYNDTGAPGGGDADYYEGDAAALQSWLGVTQPPAPVPSPVPAWQREIIARLPELAEGAVDQGGKIEWVKQIQYLLDITGPGNITADGDFGPATKAAVEATQRQAGFPFSGQDGIVGPATWQVLIAFAPGEVLPNRVAEGTTDAANAIRWVHRIQAYCNVHGEPATIDGIFGPGTAAAVKGVQKAYGCAQTGVVDAFTWSLLIAHAKP